MELLSYFDLHLVYLVIFSLGIAFGAGAALLSAMLFITSIEDGKISTDEYKMLVRARNIVWFGIVLYVFSGVGLFTLSASTMLGLGIFYADATIATIMIANAFLFHHYFLPQIQVRINKKLSDTGVRTNTSNLNAYLVIAETVSIVSWVFIILHHAMFRLPAGYMLIMMVYILALLSAGALVYLNTKHVLTPKNTLFLKGTAIAGGVITVVLGGLIMLNAHSIVNISFAPLKDIPAKDATAQVDKTLADSEANTTYTLDEVAMHSNVEDCWVAIEGAVFDASPAAEKYPDVYLCGEDSTEAYRAIRDEGISERVQSYQIGLLGFTLEEVAENNTDDSCWFVIDDLVFDATKEAQLHPAMFNCGTDVSDNYHRNHGDTISDKMMESHIGSVDDGILSMFTGNPANKREVLEPYRELYVDEGSWDNHELIVVVEKDAEKLLFIDGKTHTELGRIHEIGFQPHTSVYSPDAKYMYIIARNGWLTKIDLDTMMPVKSVSVGESSRGTALTDDGKYLAIGNYVPGNVVMVDPVSMEILKEIPTTGEIDGKQIESRVGAMIEDGDKVIVALKDLNSVWVIDTSDSNFPVIEKHWNIGSNETPLHDAFLTPDGKYYIVASMGSNTVWVMDTDNWEEVKEVPTGETPHTGPGATWGNKVYIPALGEGMITSIDMTTWEVSASIPTAGPGLFIRAFNEDPDYPYVWAETAFGEFHDEIYVIDARIDEVVETIRPVAGESSWHPEFTNDGQFVYIVSQTANEVEVYDAWTFEIVKRFEANTPSAVSNIGNRIEEKGL